MLLLSIGCPPVARGHCFFGVAASSKLVVEIHINLHLNAQKLKT